MKKYLFALVISAAFAASDSRADFGTPPAPPAPSATGGAPTGGGGGGSYGWNPIVKRILFWKKSDAGSCANGKCGPTPGAGVPGIPGNGMAMPGTLVFPTHPYARSPRDYFMYGHGGN